MNRLALILVTTLASPVVSPPTAEALGTKCDPCWGNRTGCGSYFLQSCNEGNG